MYDCKKKKYFDRLAFSIEGSHALLKWVGSFKKLKLGVLI